MNDGHYIDLSNYGVGASLRDTTKLTPKTTDNQRRSPGESTRDAKKSPKSTGRRSPERAAAANTRNVKETTKSKGGGPKKKAIVNRSGYEMMESKVPTSVKKSKSVVNRSGYEMMGDVIDGGKSEHSDASSKPVVSEGYIELGTRKDADRSISTKNDDDDEPSLTMSMIERLEQKDRRKKQNRMEERNVKIVLIICPIVIIGILLLSAVAFSIFFITIAVIERNSIGPRKSAYVNLSSVYSVPEGYGIEQCRNYFKEGSYGRKMDESIFKCLTTEPWEPKYGDASCGLTCTVTKFAMFNFEDPHAQWILSPRVSDVDSRRLDGRTVTLQNSTFFCRLAQGIHDIESGKWFDPGKWHKAVCKFGKCDNWYDRPTLNRTSTRLVPYDYPDDLYTKGRGRWRDNCDENFECVDSALVPEDESEMDFETFFEKDVFHRKHCTNESDCGDPKLPIHAVVYLQRGYCSMDGDRLGPFCQLSAKNSTYDRSLFHMYKCRDCRNEEPNTIELADYYRSLCNGLGGLNSTEAAGCLVVCNKKSNSSGVLKRVPVHNGVPCGLDEWASNVKNYCVEGACVYWDSISVADMIQDKECCKCRKEHAVYRFFLERFVKEKLPPTKPSKCTTCKRQ